MVQESQVSSSTSPQDSAEILVRESSDAPKLGTKSNPIVIRDDPTPPFVIQVDEEWCCNDPDQLGSSDDTEIISTPEFWADLTRDSLVVPADECSDADLLFVLPSTPLPDCEDREESQVLEQSSVNHQSLDEEETTEKAFEILEDHVAAFRDCGSNQTDQGKDEDKSPTAEESTSVCRGSPDTCSMNDQSKMQERPRDTDISTLGESSHETCDRESTKRKVSYSDGVSSGLRRSGRLVKKARQWL